MTEPLGPVGLALAVLLCGTAGVEAHALIDRTEPQAGSALRTAPAQVRVWFTESLEPAFSGVQVVNAADQRVDKGDSQVDRANLRLLRISLPSLPPGTYKVIWRVLSIDGHVTQGDFIFRVIP